MSSTARMTPQRAANEIDRARSSLAVARRALADATTVDNTPDVIFAGQWKRVSAALEERASAIARIPGVVGYGMGHKVKDGTEVEEPSLVVFVRRKLSHETLAKRGQQRLPRFVRIGSHRIPVDVVAMGRPAPHGAVGSIGAVTPLSAGTIGVLGRDVASGQPVLITAMHTTGASVCTNPQPVPAVSFTVPSRRDVAAAPVIGSLAAGTTYGVDAAKILVTNPGAVAPYLPPVRVLGWRPPSNDVGTTATMFGRTSGLQSGVIKYVNVAIPELCLTRAYLVAISSDSGDSGAGLVDAASLLLGFLFGLAPTAYGPYRIFSPASLVLPRLGCTVP